MRYFTQASDRVKAYEEITKLDLPEKEKAIYKKNVADPGKDFSTVLIEGKTTARELKRTKLESTGDSQKWSPEVLSEMIGELSDDGEIAISLLEKEK